MIRFRDMENMVAYKDKEIAEIQVKLVSAKKIKKIQERSILLVMYSYYQ